MKRKDRIIETRPDASRRSKPCSKIEAKLLSRRRSKMENEEKKSARLTKTPKNSSSESEISPRFFTSKQHVELANFESRNFSSLFEKNPRNSNGKFKYDVGSGEKRKNSRKIKGNNVERENSTRINVSITKIVDSDEQLDGTLNLSKSRSKNVFDYFSKQYLNDSKSIINIHESSKGMKKDSKMVIERLSMEESNGASFFAKNQVNKKRSRSAPCTPLFKIKCSKDKLPRDLFAVGKSLADDEIREKIRKHRKDASVGLRISRSGDVSVSSYEKSSNERIIERTSSEESTKADDRRQLIFFVEKLQKSEADCGVKLARDFDKCEITREEITDAEEGKSKSEENNELKESLEAFKDNSEAIDNVGALSITEENIDDEINSMRDEKHEEMISSTGENFEDKKEPEIGGDKRCTPTKLPKKRDFKWETLMEKQHRLQLVSRDPEKCIEPVESFEKIGNDKFKFWSEKTADMSKKNFPPKIRNSFEEKQLEAYNIMKEELPKLFMKRKILDSTRSKNNEIEGKTKHYREFEKPNSLVLKNGQIVPRITNSNCKHFQRTERDIYPCGKSNFVKSSENHASRKNISTNVDEERKNVRPSILKRTKSPSPRRVTFRLPGLVIDKKSAQEENNYPKLIGGKEETEVKSSPNPEDKERSSNACIHEKAHTSHNENSSICKGAINFPMPPRFSTVESHDNSSESEDFAQDWETPTSEDINRTFEAVKFPKETRQAMKILLRAEENSRCNDFGQENGRANDRRGTYRKSVENCRPQNVPVAPSYAEALAKFQGNFDREQGQQNSSVIARRSGGSRNANVAVEIGENEHEASIKKCSSKTQCENFRPSEVESLKNQSVEESRKFREIINRCVISRTMQSNGSETGISENGVDRTGWTVGLINGKFKYLTAETFGFKINANGASLKKKQLWTLEGSEHQVYLRSHLDRYLAVDQFGNVTCEAEDPSDPGCAFQIQLASDGSGRWALKNVQRGYFLGSSQDELKCMAKAPGDAEYWLVHLAARPQVNLRSAGRKRFAHLSASQDEIHVDAPVPWGEDTLFTLEFRAAAMADNEAGPGHGQGGKTEGGHYALHTCNNKYLARDGKLLDSCTRDCLYAAEFHAGLLALRDIHGSYLAPIGSKAVLKSRSTTVTRDELFSLEESLPQASFVAALNQRYVSVKQGVDVTANQDEISGHETFQLEFDRVTKRWYVRTMQDRYWSLEAGGGIQASDHKRSSNALFDLVWQTEDGTVSIRANNGKFLATKRSGHLYANSDSPDSGDSDASKYYFYLMNRPILVLRCEQGFVGPKSAASPKLECNKAGYETIRVERCERGIVRFKGQNGKYWHADSEGVTVDSDLPSEGFYLELREPSRLCIKCTDGRYLTAGKNGALRLGETDHDSATKWEF